MVILKSSPGNTFSISRSVQEPHLAPIIRHNGSVTVESMLPRKVIERGSPPYHVVAACQQLIRYHPRTKQPSRAAVGGQRLSNGNQPHSHGNLQHLKGMPRRMLCGFTCVRQVFQTLDEPGGITRHHCFAFHVSRYDAARANK